MQDISVLPLLRRRLAELLHCAAEAEAAAAIEPAAVGLLHRVGWMLLLALTMDFPKGFSAWFSLVPMPSRLAWAIIGGAVLDIALAGSWEFLLRYLVRSLRSLCR